VSGSTQIADSSWAVHLVSAADWPSTSMTIEPPSLGEVEFVHLSWPEQIHIPANAFYAGRRDLLLLWVDVAVLLALGEGVFVVEDGVPPVPGQQFPHLYAPLPVAAVRHAAPYVPGPDGRFAALASNQPDSAGS